MPTLLFYDIMPRSRDVAGMALSGDDALTTIARQNIVLLERFVSAIDPILLPAAANRAIDHIALAARFFFEGNVGRHGHGASSSYFARLPPRPRRWQSQSPKHYVDRIPLGLFGIEQLQPRLSQCISNKPSAIPKHLPIE